MGKTVCCRCLTDTASPPCFKNSHSPAALYWTTVCIDPSGITGATLVHRGWWSSVLDHTLFRQSKGRLWSSAIFSSSAGLPEKQDQMQTTNIPSSAPARQRSYGAGEVQGKHSLPDQQEKLQAGHMPRTLVFFPNLPKPSLEENEDWHVPWRAMWLWKQNVKSSPFLLNKGIFRSQSHGVSSLLYVFILRAGWSGIWYLPPFISSHLAGLSFKGAISSAKERTAVQSVWREVMENVVFADKSSRTGVTYW